ncbi:MAG TPA: hypothetical protein VD814_11600 [Nocardioides sp.]|nr:hypothetical protein [Nocardioides sp.]
MSTERGEDEAWRSIVENYGERARLDEPAVEPAPAAVPEESRAADDRPSPWEDEDRFVPPVPPPAPQLRTPQRLAWSGVIGTPVVLLLALLAGVSVPPLLGYALVVAFVGGFLYLVTTMGRGSGRDPWDDGARV